MHFFHKFWLRAFACAALLAAAAPLPGFSSAPAAAQDNAASTSEDFELVLQVVRNQEVLSNMLLGMQRGFTGFYIPVRGLADILDLYAEIDLENGQARGWYLKPENSWEIDAKAGTATIRGELVDLGPDDVIVKDYGAGFGDVYVRLETLNMIWPLEMELDFGRLRLAVNTPAKLPYEAERDRRARRERLLAAREGEQALKGLVPVENDYRLISPPVVDISSVTRWESEDSGDSSTENRTNFFGKNDLFYFTADYNLNLEYLNDEFVSPDDMRLTLTRRAFGDETMPLGLREVRLGDVGTRASDLISNSDGGRGATVSSRPFRRIGAFDEVTIEGTATPGWEIELYRGGELLEFDVVPDTGEYRFDGVDLLAGNNQIRVVLYGPAGQVEERVEEYLIGSGLLRPGEIDYEASVVDTNENLISFTDDDDLSGRSAFRREEDGLAYSGAVRAGVNRFMSLFATGTKAITREGEGHYATVGADLSLGPVLGSIEGYKQLGGGAALDTRFATRLMGWRVNLRNQFMNEFESDRVGYDDDARVRNTQVSLSNRFDTGLGQMGLTATADYEKEKDEDTLSRYQISNFLSQRKFDVGNRLTWQYQNGELRTLNGLANAGFRIGRKTNVRSTLDYNVRPDFALSSISTDVDYRHSDKLSAGFNVNRNLINSGTTLGGNINYDFDYFLGSLASTWRQDNGINLTVRASTSLAPFGEGGDYIMRSRSMQNQNALNSHVYLDRNLNNLYDFGDDPVDNAVLLLNNWESLPSDEEGFVSMIQGSRGDYAALTFKENSTDNPFHASSKAGYSVLLRPGVRQSIDFALVETGIIDGIAYFENGKPVPGLQLQLLDWTGEVIKETMTSYDGFYTFEFVKPGSYIIRSSPSLDVHVPVRMVTVSPDALFAYGVNVRLLENAGLPPSAVTVDPVQAQQNIVPILSSLSRLQNTLRNAVSGS